MTNRGVGATEGWLQLMRNSRLPFSTPSPPTPPTNWGNDTTERQARVNQLLADVAQANVTKPVIRKQIVHNYFPPYSITQLQQELVWDQQGKFCTT
ncbi:hypothetical protein DYB36_005173 [Aphanomyces astaci]|uniref:Uncharacterized protein n=1 Tax=Aphanomyces astaci TaxID=112090 RepID=A0A397AYL6_APHAT|nr:hypothetical protein DYB36_005173 [Aphanomyces astaci]